MSKFRSTTSELHCQSFTDIFFSWKDHLKVPFCIASNRLLQKLMTVLVIQTALQITLGYIQLTVFKFWNWWDICSHFFVYILSCIIPRIYQHTFSMYIYKIQEIYNRNSFIYSKGKPAFVQNISSDFLKRIPSSCEIFNSLHSDS